MRGVLFHLLKHVFDELADTAESSRVWQPPRLDKTPEGPNYSSTMNAFSSRVPPVGLSRNHPLSALIGPYGTSLTAPRFRSFSEMSHGLS
jgi:hypothetical protein